MPEAGVTRDASPNSLGAIVTVAPPIVGATIFEPGALIGARYRVIRFLARGGMGEVYEAEDLELELRVAVKTIRAELIGQLHSIERVKREILAARRVSHPNVVRLHDVGYHVLPNQREVAFITMDLLEGDTLETYLRERAPLSPEQATPLVAQLAAALDAAHAADVVHRDFKPQNVIVLPPGPDEPVARAVITDFGLAEAGADLEPSSTATVEFVGTPAYMAPEQVSRMEPVTKAADIYAFGVVMFEMVTGQRPFQGKTALATAARRLEVPPPSPREYVPALPVAWEQTILRCLARDPSLRFASAGAAVAALAAPARPRRPVWARWLAALAVVAGVGVAALAVIAMRDRSGAAGASAAAVMHCAAPTSGELWVDAAAPPGGSGTSACPLRTISAALALPLPRPGAPKLIHVARGTYDGRLGEDFPLIVRGEVRLVGAGIDRTVIVGTGQFDTSIGAGSMNDEPIYATLAVGDAHARIEIEGLSLAPSAQGGRVSVGVLCTRGNLSHFEDPPLPANTLLRGVALGPGYGTSVIVATETVPAATGCNLRLEDARVQGGQSGVWAAGCGTGKGRVPTGLEVVSSTFSGMHDTAPLSGAGILLWDCTRQTVVQKSVFELSDRGVAAVRHGTAEVGTLRIQGSTFRTLDRAGITLDRAVRLEQLEDNGFVHVIAPGPLDAPAPALQLRGVKSDFPTVVARKNTFLQGDLGIELQGATPPAATTSLDFGRPDDPGDNHFVCNSRGVDAAIPGGDVVVALPSLGGARLLLHGNVWDHAPPTLGGAPRNGLDVLVPAALRGALDIGGARPTKDACNLGVAGP